MRNGVVLARKADEVDTVNNNGVFLRNKDVFEGAAQPAARMNISSAHTCLALPATVGRAYSHHSPILTPLHRP